MLTFVFVAGALLRRLLRKTVVAELSIRESHHAETAARKATDHRRWRHRIGVQELQWRRFGVLRAAEHVEGGQGTSRVLGERPYRDADGKRRTVSGPTRVQAEARREVKLAKIAAMPAVGSRFSRDTTVAELTEWWLDSVARHQVKTSTLDSYTKFASYLADDIGTHRVVDVGAETLTKWQSDLLDKFAPYTVLNCRKVCRQAFTEAVKFGLIPANPFDLVKAPRGEAGEGGPSPHPR